MDSPVFLRSLDDRARLILRGPDRKRFLHGMVTNDINGLAPGHGCHAAMLTVKGKMLADMAVHACGQDTSQSPSLSGDKDFLLLEMEGPLRHKIREALYRYLVMDDVTIEDVTDELGELGVYGQGAAAALHAAIGAGVDFPQAPYHHVEVPGGEGGALRVAATVELRLAGYHVFGALSALSALSSRLLAAGARKLGEDEAEVLRVEAGVPRYGLDIDEDRLPVEARLDDAVSFTKGCYLGQEVVARVTARGHINRKLVGLRFPGVDAPPPRGTKLSHETRPDAGTVMTAVYSPRHGVIALGYVHRSVWQPGTRLTVSAGGEGAGAGETGAPPGQEVKETEGSGLLAIVADLPFAEPQENRDSPIP